MAVQYNDGANYVCDHLKKRYGEPLCQHFTASHVDQAVVNAFLEVIEPARIEATLATLEQLEQQRQASDRLWQQRIERAKYEVERAHRQFSRVEPENRWWPGNWRRNGTRPCKRWRRYSVLTLRRSSSKESRYRRSTET